MSDDQHPGDDATRPGPGSEPVGSVGEEAAKLLDAVAGWVRDTGTAVGAMGQSGGVTEARTSEVSFTESVSDLAGRAAETLGGLGSRLEGHVDVGAPECAWCPVCRTAHVIRTAGPDVGPHLSAAASSLRAALAGLLGAVASDRPQPEPETGPETGPDRGHDGSWQRIDLDADDGTDA